MNHTLISPYGSEAFSGTEDMRPNTTKDAPLLLLLRKFQGFGSCEPGTMAEGQNICLL